MALMKNPCIPASGPITGIRETTSRYVAMQVLTAYILIFTGWINKFNQGEQLLSVVR